VAGIGTPEETVVISLLRKSLTAKFAKNYRKDRKENLKTFCDLCALCANFATFAVKVLWLTTKD
jgi:hypothetical protein